MSRSAHALPYKRWFLATALAVPLFSLSCGNPAVDVRIAALGEEKEGVPPGEHHRPGQPCVLCHSSYGGAEPIMTVGGTIFAGRVGDRIPANGAEVTFIDAFGNRSPVATTNCAGNFWLTEEQWNPGFPLLVEIICKNGAGTEVRQSMATRIARDGSCAGCHEDGPANQGTAGRVYCAETPSGFPPPENCPGF
jgi:hypothetical protein